MERHSLPKLPQNLQILNCVLSALKTLGQCPLSSGVGPKISYKSNWFSRGTFECLPGAVLISFAWFVMITHLALPTYFIFGPGIRQAVTETENQLLHNPTIDENMKTANICICRIVLVCLALRGMVHILWGWADKQKLAELMNNWEEIRIKLRSMVLVQNQGIKEGVTYHFIVAVTSVYVCTITGVYIFIVIKGYFEACYHQLTFISFSFMYLIIEALQDAKVAIIFHQLANDFKQVRKAMDGVFNVKNLTVNNVRAWRQLVILTRRQTYAAAEHLAIPELTMLLQTLLVGLGAIFVAIYDVWGTARFPVQHYCIYAVVYLLVRLFIKTTLAEKITQAEERIVQELMDLHTDDSIRIEIKDLQDILLQSPKEIILANVVVMRKKLCLGVISQIVTYLIVLIQFYGN